MTKIDETLENNIKNLSNSELIRIVKYNYENYTSEAMTVVESEIKKRGGLETVESNIINSEIIQSANEAVNSSSKKELKKGGVSERQASVMASVILIFVFGLFLLGFLHTCTDTFTTKEEFVEKAKKKELGAMRQKGKYAKSGNKSHLYGAAEYYRDAIKYYSKAIEVEKGDVSFDEKMLGNIEMLQNQLGSY